MVVILKKNAPAEQVEQFQSWLAEHYQLEIHESIGQNCTLLGLVGDTTRVDIDLLQAMEIVENVRRIGEPYKFVNRKMHPQDTVVDCGGVPIGGGHFTIVAGPCSVESEEQILYVAQRVKAAGAGLLRGGAFKPRTSSRACAEKASVCFWKPKRQPVCPLSPKLWIFPSCLCLRTWM